MSEPKPAPAAKDTAPPAAAKPAPGRPAAASRVSRLVEAAARTSISGRIDMGALRARLPAAGPATLLPTAAGVALVLSLGVGYGVGRAQHGQPDATADALAQLRDATGEMRRVAAEIRAAAAKPAADAGAGERSAKGDGGGRQAQILDRMEKAAGEQGARIAKLAEQLDRLEKAPREQGRGPSLADRLDRIEKSIATLLPAPAMPAPAVPAKQAAAKEPSAPAVVADVGQTGAIPDKAAKAESDPRKTQIDGFYVRDVDSGFALIETRGGRYIDVAVGYVVPGVGRVESIERRGRQWVVVTAKGYIGER